MWALFLQPDGWGVDVAFAIRITTAISQFVKYQTHISLIQVFNSDFMARYFTNGILACKIIWGIKHNTIIESNSNPEMHVN
jgi:hypothetical protein